VVGGTSIAEIGDTLGRPVQYQLPEDSGVPASINSGTPIVVLNPRSRFSRGVHEIAQSIVPNGSGPVKKERRSRLLGVR
jgi:MinD-like ATPase involved in chromosome partitioning or flagellar assembly